MRSKKLVWVMMLLVLLAGGVALGGNEGAAEETKAASPLAVSTMRAEISQKQQGLRLTGTVEGLASAIISSRYSGQVEELLVENGQMVQAGTPLLRTDSQELMNNVRLAENGVRKAAVNHENIEANFRRSQSLYEQGATSRQNMESARTQWGASQSDVDDDCPAWGPACVFPTDWGSG